MLRRFDFVQDSQKLLVIFLIGFWLLLPFDFPQPDPVFFDGMDQQAPSEFSAINPDSNMRRANREISLQAASAWAGGEALIASTLSSHQTNPKQTKRALKIYDFTEVFRC